jgi:DNA-binding response OmpR family regulator
MNTDSVAVDRAELVGDGAGQGRIIVVEDDSDFRESLIETLSLCGYEVIGARSAFDFYQKVAQKSYAVVILDLGLPDQSGIVLAEFIRKNTDMRIVILTARSSLESRVAAYRAGADTYLLKPIDTAELIATVESNMGRVVHGVEGQVGDYLSLESTADSWRLVRASATLIAPTGEKITLSSKEIDFLELLATSQETNVSRAAIMAALGYDGVKSGSQVLDVLIHRLRQKSAAKGVRLPIKTVRGKGYVFPDLFTIQ